MWTTSTSIANNSESTSNVNPTGKRFGSGELRATSVSSIGPAGSIVPKIQTRFGVQLLASQSSSNSTKQKFCLNYGLVAKIAVKIMAQFLLLFGLLLLLLWLNC
ncbi:hypothetical protein ACH5RR_012763 [Cinchona calisaya]|uniref:Uncharacterized protein n=1 Tax=Cinchona calisaya TaxID=153742 RepID=A0ABD3AC87_9GENT